ncbi:sensor histidine kinase [Marinobacterium lutimaris]|uniref:sensor histidine kinase n=1 Tax=Marinobacterium lutimaris TaxID=568106 RepID=UPI00135764CB|nr:HAMP domain-containing sensor histidine kinase [Marinobacterium lutimaris]
MPLKPRHLPSFSGLLITGFILVVLPLLGGIIGMTYALEQMAFEGRRSVTVSAQITSASRQLSEAETALKRAAGQYFVLEDPALKERLDRAHYRLVEVLDRLESLPWSLELAQQVVDLARQEQALYQQLSETPASGDFESYRQAFERLDLATESLNEATTDYIHAHLVTGMNDTAARIQNTMIYLAAGMILLSLLLSAIFSWLLSRPVRKLSATIRQLGQNNLENPINIRGPRDLEHLGQQLEWLRSRLLELEEKKLNFFREVSHELKTPLTNMLEAISLLRDQVTGPLTTQQSEVVEIMRGSAFDLRQRIEDLLRYNEAIAQPTLEPDWFALTPLIDEIKGRFDLTLRSQQLRWDGQIEALQLKADRNRLSVALENLVSNAIRFSPKGGTLSIDAASETDGLRISVVDEGPGIAESQTEQLFQPFYKGTRQPQGTLKGSGLGLAIAKASIEQLGGTLRLKPSSAPGAHFEITLPHNKEVPPRG